MIVGAVKIELFLPECRSLKAKRQIVKSLIGRLQSRYNISIAEVDFHDLWQRAAIGICYVSQEEHQVRQILQKIEEILHNLNDAVVIRHQATIYHPEASS